ncbi:LiaI-LiaF-like domain-containing protein [Acetoanaerobium noterae]|uniref:LiaI-LiaF-like domain-containing protein n=1 Tax=Acetoanaerobium noterae TaxID=745369 RepID=UPI003AB95641
MKSFSKISGLLLIALGILLFLNSLGYISHTPWQLIRIYWPLIIIYLGIEGLLRPSGSKNTIFNSLVCLSGLVLLGDNLNLFHFNLFMFIDKFWPILLIILGISLIVKSDKK